MLDSPGAGVTVSCKLSDVDVGNPNSGPLKEQYAFIATDTSLQTSTYIEKMIVVYMIWVGGACVRAWCETFMEVRI